MSNTVSPNVRRTADIQLPDPIKRLFMKITRIGQRIGLAGRIRLDSQGDSLTDPEYSLKTPLTADRKARRHRPPTTFFERLMPTEISWNIGFDLAPSTLRGDLRIGRHITLQALSGDGQEVTARLEIPF